MDERRNTYLASYVFLIIGLIPLILITIYIDDESPTELSLLLSTFIDNFLLGDVGITSSLFPISSKIMSNYNALIAPLLSIVMFLFLIITRKLLEPLGYLDYGASNYIKTITYTSLLYCAFFSALCFFNIDLNGHSRLAIFSKNKYTLLLLYIPLYLAWFLMNCAMIGAYTSFTKHFFAGRCAIKK